jgi:hypothetical protein
VHVAPQPCGGWTAVMPGAEDRTQDQFDDLERDLDRQQKQPDQ